MKPFFIIVFLIAISLPSLLKADTNSYEGYFKIMNLSYSNLLLVSLDSGDLDMVYSAIKRIGEIRYTNAKPEVYEWLGQANPIANRGKIARSQQVKNIFNISIWTIGQIGDEKDAQELATYIKDIQYKDSLKYLIQAMGELHPSKTGLDQLNQLTTSVTDETIAEVLLTALLKHNSKYSAPYLEIMSKKASFSPNFRQKASEGAITLLSNGN